MVFLILYLKACWRKSTVVLGSLPSDSLKRVIDLRRIARCRRYSPPTSPAQPYAKSVRYGPPMGSIVRMYFVIQSVPNTQLTLVRLMNLIHSRHCPPMSASSAASL